MSANKSANSAVIKKLICPNSRGLMTLPRGGASAVWNKNTELFSLNETFANLWFVWFGSDRRACEVRLRQCLLGIQRYIRFDRPPRQLLGRMAPALSGRDSASAIREAAPSQLREALCMSLRPSSSLPTSWQLWAEAASSLNGVCSRDSTFQPPPKRSVPPVSSLP